MARFFVLFLVYFTVLMWPWPGVREGYAAIYRAAGNLLLPRFGGAGQVEFVAAQANRRSDTEIKWINWQTGDWQTRNAGSRFTAYVPTAIVVALVLASPVPWRRRGWALFCGLIAISAFIILRLAINALYGFSGFPGYEDIRIFSPGRFWSFCLSFAFIVLCGSPAGGFIVPVIIWATVTFRRRDWHTLFRATPAGHAALT